MAVVKVIKRNCKDAKIVYIGSRFGIESKLVPKMGIKYYGVSTGKFRRYHDSKILNIIDPTTVFKNIKDFFCFLKGIKEAKAILAHEKPDVVFAKGGFVSLPVGYAARFLRIPVVAHESDVIMGLSNRKVANFAEKVCVAFPTKYYEEVVDKKKLIETGNPIRDDILMGNGDKFKEKINFSENKKTLLVLGGSQGSRFINELILEKIEDILVKWQVIWIAGDRGVDLVNYQIEALPEELRNSVKVCGFLTTEMADVYAASDLVISRAGSNVLFELAALTKPAILIPFGEASGSHQLANARLFSRSGAAYLFRQSNLSADKLFHQIDYLFKNSGELKSMQEAMKKWADLGAAEKVANITIGIGEKKIEADREAKTKK